MPVLLHRHVARVSGDEPAPQADAAEADPGEGDGIVVRPLGCARAAGADAILDRRTTARRVPHRKAATP